MTQHPARIPYDGNNDGFDLSTIFLGREQQLSIFEIYLDRWKQQMFNAPVDDTVIVSAPSPNNKIQGLVVLLYGRGGFGKSTLLSRYRDMVLQQGHSLTLSTIVDWEFAIEGKRSVFNPPVGREVDAPEYFRGLCGQLAMALARPMREFHEYQAAVMAVEKAQKAASGVLDSMQKDDRYDWLRELSVEAIKEGISRSVPGSKAVLENEKVKTATSAVAKLTQEQLSHVYTMMRKKLGDTLDDYLDPSLRLGMALGKDLRKMAKNFPLLIFFDTYEEIDEGDRLLRMVMGAAGLRVGWVMAGRDNLWAGSDQIARSIALEYGYKEIVLADRGLAVDFNAGGIGAFTLSDITGYFEILCSKVRYDPPLPSITEEGAKRIQDVTQGVPLAVKIAAGLYKETADLDTISEQVAGKRAIIDQMVRRYLLHARDDNDERAKLYGLAMLRRADVEHAVAAALDLTPDEAKTRYACELSRLQRRYSFIFTEKKEAALHQEVRTFLRLWLLERNAQPEIVAVNERLKVAHEAELSRLEQQRNYGTVKARLEDEEWVETYLDLTEQQFWLEVFEGVRYALPFMIAVAIYRRSATQDVERIGEFFQAKMKSPYLGWWKCAAQGLSFASPPLRSLRTEGSTDLPRELTQLAQVVHEQHIGFPNLVPNFSEALEAMTWWKLGDAFKGGDDTKAVEWYERALSQLKQEVELKETAARTYWQLAYNLYKEKKYAECLPLLNRAIELKPDYTYANNNRGFVYAHLRQFEQALQDYNRTLELDPSYVNAYNGRGLVYADLKQNEQALQDFNRAIELGPTDADAYYNRGAVYRDLKQNEQALQDFNRVIELDPTDVGAYYGRGTVYHRLKQYEQALQDFNRAIELDPTDVGAYYGRGTVYHRLKQNEQALQDYKRVIELDPTDADSYNGRGNVYADLKQNEQALQDYNLAIELDPSYVDAYNGRGLVYADLKQNEQALQDFNRAIELDPSYVYGYNNRGLVYRRLKQNEQALQNYNRAIELDSTYVKRYYRRGNVYADLKQNEQALQDYKRALELDPNDINCWWMVEWAKMPEERIDIELAERLERIAGIDPQSYLGYTCRGVAAGLRGKLKEGLEQVERAIILDPDEWDAYFWKGMLCAYYYQGESRNQVALAAIEQAIKVGLPVGLLRPLYWLEKDMPEFFERCARPLLEKYEV